MTTTVSSNSTLTFLDTKKKYIKTLPVSVLCFAPYQRKHSPMKVKNIVKNFDPVGLGLIYVSKRDGKYYVIDGQHRYLAIKAKGLKNVECLVFEGLTYEEESRAFVYFNTIKNANRLDRANALLEADDARILKIKSVVEKVGLELDFKGTGRGIRAFTAIERIFDQGGEKHLENVLRLLLDCFGHDNKAFLNYMLLGFHDFVRMYDGEYKRNDLVKSMKKIGVNVLEMKAKEFRQVHGDSMPKTVRMAIVYFYNRGRRKENKLNF